MGHDATWTGDTSTKKSTEMMPKQRAQMATDAGNAVRASGPKQSVVADWYDQHPSDVSREIRGVRPGPVMRVVEFVRRLALEPKGNPGAVIAAMLMAASEAIASDLWADEIAARFRRLRSAMADHDAAELRSAVHLASVPADDAERLTEMREQLTTYEPHLITAIEARLTLLCYVRALQAHHGWRAPMGGGR